MYTKSERDTSVLHTVVDGINVVSKPLIRKLFDIPKGKVKCYGDAQLSKVPGFDHKAAVKLMCRGNTPKKPKKPKVGDLVLEARLIHHQVIHVICPRLFDDAGLKSSPMSEYVKVEKNLKDVIRELSMLIERRVKESLPLGDTSFEEENDNKTPKKTINKMKDSSDKEEDSNDEGHEDTSEEDSEEDSKNDSEVDSEDGDENSSDGQPEQSPN
ncbi:hypothetical protein Sjap_020240 [Stephania japonica]|uniref:Uncharacterized protein n=1 Tax=Stephania japonica TaxID=461633 RepID=A0AAP0F1P7_9MAGN